ncbi:hypothetical protein [Paenibacillus contaminans]|uniref:Uncharacterized protein n=1 Tax=Paenibacillus contaminans TaxID=450362 RepID=A0A329M9T3_9BACL|nr:hypothetical protein [Paenibacillus contaminans]RAV16741.1 hypothetical protein DQG23_28315 [Paenibacillus contaminans]
MVPIYGWVSSGVFVLMVISLFILFNRYRKNGKKPNTYIIVTLCIVLVTSICFALKAKDEKHRNEITSKIISQGGQVISIVSINKENTPFAKLDNKIAKRKDDYYIVKYTINDEFKIAWFKGDNAFYRDPPTLESEKWIFDK